MSAHYRIVRSMFVKIVLTMHGYPTMHRGVDLFPIATVIPHLTTTLEVKDQLVTICLVLTCL